jgi:hypothetical protein
MVWIWHPASNPNDNDIRTGEWCPYLHDCKIDAENTIHVFQTVYSHWSGLKMIKKRRPVGLKFEELTIDRMKFEPCLPHPTSNVEFKQPEYRERGYYTEVKHPNGRWERHGVRGVHYPQNHSEYVYRHLGVDDDGLHE